MSKIISIKNSVSKLKTCYGSCDSFFSLKIASNFKIDTLIDQVALWINNDIEFNIEDYNDKNIILESVHELNKLITGQEKSPKNGWYIFIGRDLMTDEMITEIIEPIRPIPVTSFYRNIVFETKELEEFLGNESTVYGFVLFNNWEFSMCVMSDSQKIVYKKVTRREMNKNIPEYSVTCHELIDKYLLQKNNIDVLVVGIDSLKNQFLTEIRKKIPKYHVVEIPVLEMKNIDDVIERSIPFMNNALSRENKILCNMQNAVENGDTTFFSSPETASGLILRHTTYQEVIAKLFISQDCDLKIDHRMNLNLKDGIPFLEWLKTSDIDFEILKCFTKLGSEFFRSGCQGIAGYYIPSLAPPKKVVLTIDDDFV